MVRFESLKFKVKNSKLRYPDFVGMLILTDLFLC
jgi:hypothetical protein